MSLVAHGELVCWRRLRLEFCPALVEQAGDRQWRVKNAVHRNRQLLGHDKPVRFDDPSPSLN